MKVRIKDLEPNPFRNVSKYPIDREKVKELRASIRDTSFWDNIVGRKRDGKVQIAYGHHRLAALKEEMNPGDEVDIITRPLTDEQMVKIMARENMEESRSVPLIDQETIRTIVEGYAKGIWDLPKPSGKGVTRYAPAFGFGVDEKMGRVDLVGAAGEQARSARSYPYTAETLGEFAGMPLDRVKIALNALEAIDDKKLTSAHFKDLSHEAAKQIVREVKRVDDPEKARKMATHIQQSYVTKKKAREKETVRKIADSATPKKAKAVDWNDEALRFSGELMKVWMAHSSTFRQLETLLKHKEEISVRHQNTILNTLDTIAERASKLASLLRGVKTGKELVRVGGAR